MDGHWLEGDLKAVVITATVEPRLPRGKLQTCWGYGLPQWTFSTGTLAGLIISDLELLS